MTASKRRTVWVFLAVILMAALVSACSAEAKINVGNSSSTGGGTGGASNPANEVIVFVTATPAPFQLTQAAADATFSADQIIAAQTLIPLQQTQAADMVRGTQVAVSVQATATAFPLQETQMAAAVIARDLTATTVALIDRKQAETLQGETGLVLGVAGGTSFFLLAVAVAVIISQETQRFRVQAETARIEAQRRARAQEAFLGAQRRAEERLETARRRGAEAFAEEHQVPPDGRNEWSANPEPAN